ncbi:MAG TPA: hypothetical protein VMM93_01795 [Vicinamibacterales bacterium]|nr:hypothetical protein [Vicinamibacterales bacterium]
MAVYSKKRQADKARHHGASTLPTGDIRMFELWVSVALLGVWSCIGVFYNNSRKASKQMDEVVKLLAEIAVKA